MARKKECCKCGGPKEDEWKSYCKNCQAEYRAEHYKNNHDAYIQKSLEQKRRIAKKVNEIKSQPCMDCGKAFHPWQMSFDHRPGTKKVLDIASLIRRRGLKRVLEEIEKCDAVCLNCHADRTHNRSRVRA